jgi:hypothetical protein
MGASFVILVVAMVGTIALSFRKAAAVEAKVQRVLGEFQKLGENLDEMQALLQGSVDELRREMTDNLEPKKKK